MPLLGQPIKSLFGFPSWSACRSLKQGKRGASPFTNRCGRVPLTISALKLRPRYTNNSR
jgi:hypothetical protein